MSFKLLMEGWRGYIKEQEEQAQQGQQQQFQSNSFCTEFSKACEGAYGTKRANMPQIGDADAFETDLEAGAGEGLETNEPEKIPEAKNSGADIFGSDDLIEKISSGKFNFTKLICTPAMMGKVGKHGKVLGPKGLMPNPKLGTVSNDLARSVKDIKFGLIEIKNDKDGNLASSIGRKSYSIEKLLENYNYFIENVKKEKPDTIKGEFIKNIFITSTMGISYKIGAK